MQAHRTELAHLVLLVVRRLGQIDFNPAYPWRDLWREACRDSASISPEEGVIILRRAITTIAKEMEGLDNVGETNRAQCLQCLDDLLQSLKETELSRPTIAVQSLVGDRQLYYMEVIVRLFDRQEPASPPVAQAGNDWPNKPPRYAHIASTSSTYSESRIGKFIECIKDLLK